MFVPCRVIYNSEKLDTAKMPSNGEMTKKKKKTVKCDKYKKDYANNMENV